MSMREHTIMNKLFELDAFQNDSKLQNIFIG